MGSEDFPSELQRCADPLKAGGPDIDRGVKAASTIATHGPDDNGIAALFEESLGEDNQSILFYCRVPRSGTTLFRHMVNAHPQMAVTPEAHWLPVFFRRKRRGLTPEGIVTPDLIQQCWSIQVRKFPHTSADLLN